MGYYINPPDMSKEQFLQKHGTPINPNDYQFNEEKLPVCLVDNGWMTAAGIAPDARELAVFNDPADARPKLWFEVSRELLAPYL